MNLKFLGLQRKSDKMLDDLDKFEKLKKIANKNNYPYKVGKLKERLANEFKFWMTKGPSAKLTDIERDIKFIASQLDKSVIGASDKLRIDTLVEKYPID